MVRKLFNNRWFIALLAAASLLLMVHSIAVEMWGGEDLSEFADEEMLDVGLPDDGIEDDAGTRAFTAEGDPSKTILRRRLTWNTQPRRDPFSVQQNSEQVSYGLTASAQPVAGGKPHLPRLEALVAGPDSQFAVLGDQVVAAGDRIGDYRILNITPHGVRVATAHGSVWLPPPGTPE